MANSPTVRRRRLASELRRLRESAGLTIDDAARAADVSKSSLSRIENAIVGVKVPILRSLLTTYGVDTDSVESLVQLAREASQRGWWHQFGTAVPEWFQVYVGLETDATALRIFEIQIIPGLFQTEAYAREIFRVGNPKESAEEIERRVALRMSRQDVLRGEKAPQLWVVLDEASLRREVGGRGVMRDQLEHLLDVAALPTVAIQVLPYAAGAHPAMGAPYTIMSFDRGDPDVVYRETSGSALYLENQDQVEWDTLAFDYLRAAALSPDHSVSLIRRVIKDLS